MEKQQKNYKIKGEYMNSNLNEIMKCFSYFLLLNMLYFKTVKLLPRRTI